MGTSQALCRPLLSLAQPLSRSLSSTSHFRLCLSVVSAEVRLRGDRGLGRVAWAEGGQTEGPRPANPVIASLACPPRFFVRTRNSSPAPPLAPSLGQGWECPNLGFGRVLARSPSWGGVGGSKAESLLAPVPGGSVGRVGCWPGQDTQGSSLACCRHPTLPGPQRCISSYDKSLLESRSFFPDAVPWVGGAWCPWIRPREAVRGSLSGPALHETVRTCRGS